MSCSTCGGLHREIRLLAWVGQTLIIAEQNSQLETPGGDRTVQEFAHAHDMSVIYDNASRPVPTIVRRPLVTLRIAEKHDQDVVVYGKQLLQVTGRIVTQRPYDAFSYRVLAQISIGSASSISEPDEWYIDETGESLHDPLAAGWLSQIL